MPRFRLDECCLAVLLVCSFTVVYAERPYLAHKCVRIFPSPPNKLPVVFLHGIADIKETWEGIYESIPLLTGRRVCVYDARDHGDSSWNDTFNVDILTEDLGHFLTDMNIEKAALVGHSMGGLTVMKFALKNPEKVESVFVEDISPTSVTEEVDDFLKNFFKSALDAIAKVPEDANEEEVKVSVTNYFEKEKGMQLEDFLFKRSPFRCKDGVWQWKANFDAFMKTFEKHGYFAGNFEGIYNGRSYVIYGNASPFKVYTHEEDIKKLFPKADFFGVDGAGHLVHPSNSTLYRNKLVQFLNAADSEHTTQDSF